MKKIFLLVFVINTIITLNAQIDTIAPKTGKLIIGKITYLNESAIFYTDIKGYSSHIYHKDVSFYSKDGIRNNNKLIPDTSKYTSDSVIVVNKGLELGSSNNNSGLAESVGNDLDGAANMHFLGTGLIIAGAGIATSPLYSEVVDKVVAVGGAMILVGEIVRIFAWVKVKSAGKKLKKANLK